MNRRIDWMPPRAVVAGSVPAFLATGNVQIDAGKTADAVYPVMRWDGSARGPLALYLGSPTVPRVQNEAGAIANTNPFWGDVIEIAGISHVLQNVAISGIQQLGARLEYGQGAAVRRVHFDWRAGVYLLPPCNQVSLSVVGRQQGIYAGTVSEGELGLQYDVPTFTVMGQGSAFGVSEFPIPSAAHAVELTGGGGTVTFSSGAMYQFDEANARYIPPLSPMRIDNGPPWQATQPTPYWTFAPEDVNRVSIIRFLLGL